MREISDEDDDLNREEEIEEIRRSTVEEIESRIEGIKYLMQIEDDIPPSEDDAELRVQNQKDFELLEKIARKLRKEWWGEE